MEDYLNVFSAIISVTFSAKLSNTLPNLPFYPTFGTLSNTFSCDFFGNHYTFPNDFSYSTPLFVMAVNSTAGTKLSMYPTLYIIKKEYSLREQARGVACTLKRKTEYK